MATTGAVLAPPSPRRALVSPRQILLFVALAAVVGFLYRGILPSLVADWWNDPNFSHGFFIPVFSAYILWTEQDRLRQVRIRPSFWGLVIIAGAGLVLIAGQLGAEFFLSRTSLIFLIAGLVIYYLGWAMFRAVFFPWAMLFLMIPVPAIIFNEITFPLQLLASRLAGAVLGNTGVPVLRQGNVLELAAMKLEVAEACSGIRSLMSLEALALAYAYLLEKRNWLRIALALSALPIAVAANALRIVSTGYCVQYWDPEKAEGLFHGFSGWVIFVVSVALLFLVHRVLEFLALRWERRGVQHA